MNYVVDLDDFSESNSSLEKLCEIKNKVPNFKVTLFTIVGLCTPTFINAVKKLDWVDLCPHGWSHQDNYECTRWDYDTSISLLKLFEAYQLTKGFKAPGWQISDAVYAALRDRGWWVADQVYNNTRRPSDLKAYLLDGPNKVHGHIGHRGGYNTNELELITPQLLSLAGEDFSFVKDCI